MNLQNDKQSQHSCKEMAQPTLLRRNVVEQITGLSRSSIYQLMHDKEFPKPVKLSQTGKSVAWVSTEIYDWIAKRISERNASMKCVA